MEQNTPTSVDLQTLFDNAFNEQTPQLDNATTIETQVTTDTQEVNTENNDTIVEQTAQIAKSESNYSSRIKNYIEDGILEDIAINIDGEDVFLSEADIKDEDTYKSILEAIKAEKDKEIKNNYLPIEGLDEISKKIIEVRQKGGDILEATRDNVEAVDSVLYLKKTLEDPNFYSEEDKGRIFVDLIVKDLKSKNISDRVIKSQIEEYLETNQLEEVATDILNKHLEEHSREINKEYEKELARLNEEQEKFKNFKKEVTSKYKSFGIPENISKVLIQNATVLDKDNVSNTDRLYFESQEKDPELFAMVNFLLNNRQAFEKWVSSKAVLETKKESIKPIITVNTTRPNVKTNKNMTSLDSLAESVFEK